MEYANWPEKELEALGNVYLRHKQFAKAVNLRLELGNRVNAGSDNLRHLYDKLDNSNVVSLTERFFSWNKKQA